MDHDDSPTTDDDAHESEDHAEHIARLRLVSRAFHRAVEALNEIDLELAVQNRGHVVAAWDGYLFRLLVAKLYTRLAAKLVPLVMEAIDRTRGPNDGDVTRDEVLAEFDRVAEELLTMVSHVEINLNTASKA